MKDYLEKRAKKIKEAGENEFRYVVKDAEAIVGFVCASVEQDKNCLEVIYILPEYQRMGLGHLAWKEIAKHFDPNKKTVIRVASYNIKAINFYKKLGFKETGKVWWDEKFKMKSGNIIPTTELETNVGS